MANIIGTEFDFGGVKERVVTRADFSLDRARQTLQGETIAVIGYGVQGPAQALNLRDGGFNVIVGQRRGRSYEKAEAEGWIPDQTLFSITEATRRATLIQYLLSDAGQKACWPEISPFLNPGDALYFSHGFSIAFQEQTEVKPPTDVDVILVAPKGAGRSVRMHFLEGRGINSSFAVFQDATGHAQERALAAGMAIGSGFLFPTTFRNEVYSDLTGERGVLMGATYGLWQAAFNNLRAIGHLPIEAIRHTVEISTQTIAKIIGEKGVDGLIKELPEGLLPAFSSAFVTARAAVNPVFADLYQSVARGVETRKTLTANSKPDYREQLDSELKEIADSELGRAGSLARRMRKPEFSLVPSSIQNALDALMAGALAGIFASQYNLFRKMGHKPSEAFNETVEEATQSLFPLIHQRGIDWMYANCSSTAQRGALDWNKIFRDALQPPLLEILSQWPALHSRVLTNILGSEMWRAGTTVRMLRPENQRLL